MKNGEFQERQKPEHLAIFVYVTRRGGRDKKSVTYNLYVRKNGENGERPFSFTFMILSMSSFLAINMLKAVNFDKFQTYWLSWWNSMQNL